MNAALHDVLAATERGSVDPGGSPGVAGELGPDVDPRGLLGGGGRTGGGPAIDGVAGAGGGAGSGELGGGDGGRVSSGTRVPGSLRAYVQRYLRSLEGASE